MSREGVVAFIEEEKVIEAGKKIKARKFPGPGCISGANVKRIAHNLLLTILEEH